MGRSVFWTGLCAAIAVSAAAPSAFAGDLTDLPLEELLAHEVTSVAKKPQSVNEAAAAVFVITQEDIRRSGATTLTDLFRMAPGLEVADLSPSGQAVSARGFNGRFANKLLVLVDGRSIYVSTLSGVLWDQQILPLEEIQRIEIVRGPGATLWGANAVNGVINIVTKHAVDSSGGSVVAQVDDQGSYRATARIGGQIGKNAAARIYASQQSYSGGVEGLGPGAEDNLEARQAGFRYDAEPTATDAFTLQGDVQTGEFDQVANLDAAALAFGGLVPENDGSFKGANLLGRWSRKAEDGTGWSLQAYWDGLRRKDYGIVGRRDTASVEFSRFLRLGTRHELVLGADYRWAQDKVEGSLLRFVPQTRTEDWIGAYIQDDIALSERLRVSLGLKVERNDYTGYEYQPSARAIWTDPAGWSAWAAVSRATRTPSRLETNLSISTPMYSLAAAGELEVESMVSYEVGWRGALSKRLSLDITAYDQSYKNLIGIDPVPLFMTGVTYFTNMGEAHTRGVEAALDARLSDRWTVKIAANAMRMTVENTGLALNVNSPADPGLSPKHQVSLRSTYDVRDDLDFDVWVRRVAELEFGVPAYTDLRVRAAWRPSSRLEFYLLGLNLLDERRLEFLEGIKSTAAVIDRRVLFGVSVRR